MTETIEGPRDMSWIRTNIVDVFVEQRFFDDNADLVMDAMKDTVVLRAEYRMDRHAMHYILAARRFPEKLSATTAPQWTIRVETHTEPYDDVFGSGVRQVIDKLELVPMES